MSGPRYELNPDEWRSCPYNQVVFIGRHLNTDEIREQLNHCLAS